MAIRAHAEQGDFPANRVSRILSAIDPTTAESCWNERTEFEQ
jgi:hypothetical protein